MTGEVVDLAARRAAAAEVEEASSPHMVGRARCLACRHEWEAVAPCGTVHLECPTCACHRGVWVYPIAPPEEELIFVCDCGSDLFMIRPHGPWCVGCGSWARGPW